MQMRPFSPTPPGVTRRTSGPVLCRALLRGQGTKHEADTEASLWEEGEARTPSHHGAAVRAGRVQGFAGRGDPGPLSSKAAGPLRLIKAKPSPLGCSAWTPARRSRPLGVGTVKGKEGRGRHPEVTQRGGTSTHIASNARKRYVKLTVCVTAGWARRKPS